jgi:hypothetical protein
VSETLLFSPSIAINFTKIVPTSSLVGVPLKCLLFEVNVNHDGSASPLLRTDSVAVMFIIEMAQIGRPLPSCWTALVRPGAASDLLTQSLNGDLTSQEISLNTIFNEVCINIINTTGSDITLTQMLLIWKNHYE